MRVNLQPISKYISANPGIVLASKVGFTVIGLLAGGLAYTKVSAYIEHLAENLREMPANDKIALFVGALIGLLLTFLLVPILNLNSIEDWMLRTVHTASVLVLMVFLTTQAAISMREELRSCCPPAAPSAPRRRAWKPPRSWNTNVIIDGRIADICRTGFLEGPSTSPASCWTSCS